jgi:serine/threonine-protein kinase 11
MLYCRPRLRGVTFQPLQIPDYPLKSKHQVNQYVLESKIKAGANSTVYHAIDNTGRHFAAKATRLESESKLISVDREIRALRMLDHPNVVKLHEVLHYSEKNMVYLVMDCALGSLHNRVFPELQLAQLYRQVIEGLLYIHAQGLVHHDIKPSNILLFEDDIVKISDFGTSAPIDSVDTPLGSPAYQAPEFFDDQQTVLDAVKEDIWSLGVSLYESAFGELPYIGTNVYEIVEEIRSRPLSIPERASPALRDLLTRILVIDPRQRLSLDDIAHHPFFTPDPYLLVKEAQHCVPRVGKPCSWPAVGPTFLRTM